MMDRRNAALSKVPLMLSLMAQLATALSDNGKTRARQTRGRCQATAKDARFTTSETVRATACGHHITTAVSQLPCHRLTGELRRGLCRSSRFNKAGVLSGDQRVVFSEAKRTCQRNCTRWLNDQ
jgi:antitoxin (DNA-binding transcriptional repressor) of toxin-antitoxin stability system